MRYIYFSKLVVTDLPLWVNQISCFDTKSKSWKIWSGTPSLYLGKYDSKFYFFSLGPLACTLGKLGKLGKTKKLRSFSSKLILGGRLATAQESDTYWNNSATSTFLSSVSSALPSPDSNLKDDVEKLTKLISLWDATKYAEIIAFAQFAQCAGQGAKIKKN